MALFNFPLPPAQALAMIRDAAAGVRRVFIPERSGEGAWERLVVDRQIQRCLEDGKVVSGPDINENGHLQYRLRRASAGVEVTLTVVLFNEGGDWQVVVREVSTSDY
jgi:hypothetical protein